MTILNSDKTTNGIRVEVTPSYVPERSAPLRNDYFFVYNITITNNSSDNVKLLTRNWTIINANGDTSEIKGDGVVGEFPFLKPGENYEYFSFTKLDTDWGTMEGKYIMEKDNKEKIEISIGRFYLVAEEVAEEVSGQ
ncbi:Co2+/Mg2+ efflux protein ApaG [soil metagenome]